LNVFGAVGGCDEGLVVAADASGYVGYRLFVISYNKITLAFGLLHPNHLLTMRKKDIPGSLKSGYGFVVNPILIIVFSGLS
jgi:hypothetical protein